MSPESKSPASFPTASINDWVFDLDNTIYPAKSNLFVRVAVRITEFVAQHFNVPHDEARVIQKDLFRRYGTTMRGLMVEQGLAPEDYLHFVHDIDVMHEMQIILRRQPLLDHQPAHGRAIAPEQILLDHPRLVMRHVEMLRDKFGDPHGDAHEQVRFRRIDGVVEIEHPVIDAGGGKAGWRLGLW